MWTQLEIDDCIFEVSIDGEIKSIDHYVKNKNGYRLIKGKILKPKKLPKGYLKISINYNGKKISKSVHFLVAMAYPDVCGELFEGCVIHHKDLDKENNSAYNLQVLTEEEHIEIHRNEQTTFEKKSKAHSGKLLNHPKLSKPILQLSKDGTFICEYKSLMEAHRITKINLSQISCCCNNKRGAETAGGFKWEYKKTL